MVLKEKRKENQTTLKDVMYRFLFPILLGIVTISVAWGEIQSHVKNEDKHISKQERKDAAKKEGRDEARHQNVMRQLEEIKEVVKEIAKKK